MALHKHSNALVDVLPPEADSSISMLQADEKPDVQYSDIGGMDMQKQEIREAVELPLTHFELYKQIGIDPPRGVLMYGPPGCGKTMLAKAVAHHTTGKTLVAFILVVNIIITKREDICPFLLQFGVSENFKLLFLKGCKSIIRCVSKFNQLIDFNSLCLHSIKKNR